MVSMHNIKISYHGNSWLARIIKKANLSTGYIVYLFEREMDKNKPVLGFNRYVIAVKSPLDQTVEWHTFIDCRRACEYYLNYLCCYA